MNVSSKCSLFTLILLDAHLVGPDGALDCKMRVDDLSARCSTAYTRQSAAKGGKGNLIGVCGVAQGWWRLIGSSSGKAS